MHPLIHQWIQTKEPKPLFEIPHPPFYRGKVRDVFSKDDTLLIVTTDRVSAFDVVLGTIPFKGSLLTEQTAFWFQQIGTSVPHHLIQQVHPQILLCKKTTPIPIEVVVRGFLAGSLLREPKETRGQQYGLSISNKQKPYRAFPSPLVTPTTKAKTGHDLPISPKEILNAGLVSHFHLNQMFEMALALFQLGAQIAKKQGLLLVDTKYEFGLLDNQVILIDEVHTTDSSRYWLAKTYEERVAQGLQPDMLDKEILRELLREQGFDGSNLSHLPTLTEYMQVSLASHYWTLTETLTGQLFHPEYSPSPETVIQRYLSE